MFDLFKKNPLKKLEKRYSQLMEQAIEAQRNGNIALFSKLSFESNEILKQIEALQKDKEDS